MGLTKIYLVSCLAVIPYSQRGIEETMQDLTEEEYDAFDEKWTKTTPKVGPNGTGFFARRKAEMSAQ